MKAETTIADGQPTAATMRFAGGHPALELVNTVDGAIDVLLAPQDLVTFCRRLGMAGPDTAADDAALRDTVALRGALDSVLRARLAAAPVPGDAFHLVEERVHAAHAAAQLVQRGEGLGEGFAWTWSERDAETPVHRLAVAAAELLTSPDLARLRHCAGCAWLFLDRSRGGGRRWCSMAECGTEAKKRRYVERRRRRQQG